MIELFHKQFEKEIAGLNGSWLGKVRKSAMSRFEELGYPTTKQEGWKYTSVDSLTKIPFELATTDVKGGRIESDLVERSAFYKKEDIRLVFVNGYYSPDLSVSQSLPQGVVVGNLATILKENPKLVERYLTQTAKSQDNAFLALNTAFLRDGSFLYLPKGVVIEKPIYLCHYSWAVGRATVSHPRNLIIAEEGSGATIVEIYMGGGDETYFTNAVTEIFAGKNSVVDHYKLQQESGRATHIGSTDIHQDLQSNFSSFSISLGSNLSRNEVRTLLDAEGAECALNGLFMVTGEQHVDNQTSIDHAKPHGTSTELYKGILDGRAKGVFNGRIIVRPDAQKTSARQTNKNLVLSDDALMNTKPLLEIFANDVKCNHGATIGRLDENQVFYLRSRGLSELHARSLLTYAFASELVGRIKVAPLQTALEKLIFRRLLASDLEEA